MEERAKTVATLLEDVLAARLSPDLALRAWPDVDNETDDLLAASWHDPSHFAADADIRAKDREYADYQVKLLKQRVQAIRKKFGLL